MRNYPDKARQLRRSETLAEKLAWDLLRDRRFQRFKFRRQYPIGNCIVDFCCYQYKLVVELEGSIHSQPSWRLKDKEREAYLKRLGYKVLRLPNGIVMGDPEAFLKEISKHLASPGPRPLSPQGRD